MTGIDFDSGHKGGSLEAMLLRWSETSNGGATIVLQLCDVADLEAFKMMTLAKGKIAGQRLSIVYVEIGDDEKPKPLPEKGGPLSILAARWCQDPEFQLWLAKDFIVDEELPIEEAAAVIVRDICNVKSRRELDHNDAAAHNFHEYFRRPFIAYQEKREFRP